MGQTNSFFIHHSVTVLFSAVFLDQLGLPLPALPWLLAAGALSASGELNLALGIGTAVMGCVLADILWFYLGRYRGAQVLGFLCRISLEPDSCVRRTQNVFTKYGPRSLMVAKFVPGINTLAPPLAGMNRVSVRTFVTFDIIGSLLYTGLCLAAGCMLSRQIDQVGAVLGQMGGSFARVFVVLLAVYLAYKYWQRKRLLHKLRTARITVDELHGLLEGSPPPLIVDLRSKKELERDPASIPGAIQLSMEEIESRLTGFQRDKDIILYCSCPNEVSSARAAIRLQRIGFTRVRPLLGGIAAWKQQKYPLQANSSARLGDTVVASRDTKPALSGAEGGSVTVQVITSTG
jgi:membrane protein DedA with SNARE-associated domain/rhodanese-related sulfurtransferase